MKNHLADWFFEPTIDYKTHVQEVIAQNERTNIHTFQLFTPDFCQQIIETAEQDGNWQIEREGYDQVNKLGLLQRNDPEVIMPLKNIGLEQQFLGIVTQYVLPICKHLWISYYHRDIDLPYVIKYEAEPGGITEMDIHPDQEPISLVITLSNPNDYKGGGTYFPRWDYCTEKPEAGTAYIWPGGLSHEHSGKPITTGKRYLLISGLL